MHGSRTPRRTPPSEITLTDRLAAAFASLLFSGPVIALLWFAFNSQFALWHCGMVPVSWFLGSVALVAVLAFAFPAVGATIVERLWSALMAFGRWW